MEQNMDESIEMDKLWKDIAEIGLSSHVIHFITALNNTNFLTVC